MRCSTDGCLRSGKTPRPYIAQCATACSREENGSVPCSPSRPRWRARDGSVFLPRTSCSALRDVWSRGFAAPEAPIGRAPHPRSSAGRRCNRRASSLVVSERLRLHLAGAAHQDFDARLGFLELFPASLAQLHASFEELEGPLERKLAALHFLHDGLQLLKAGFKTQRRLIRHRYIIGAATFKLCASFESCSHMPRAIGMPSRSRISSVRHSGSPAISTSSKPQAGREAFTVARRVCMRSANSSSGRNRETSIARNMWLTRIGRLLTRMPPTSASIAPPESTAERISAMSARPVPL